MDCRSKRKSFCSFWLDGDGTHGDWTGRDLKRRARGKKVMVIFFLILFPMVPLHRRSWRETREVTGKDLHFSLPVCGICLLLDRAGADSPEIDVMKDNGYKELLQSGHQPCVLLM